MRATWNAMGLTIVAASFFALMMATGCSKELDTSACQACAANGGRGDVVALRAEAVAQGTEAAAQRAEAVFNKSMRK